MLTLAQIRFCAEECQRQQSGEMSVYWMCNALKWLASTGDITGYDFNVPILGKLIEPKKNANGYRKTPVMIGSEVLSNADLIPRQMSNLLQWLDKTRFDRDLEIRAKDFYYSFEKVHPFIDGNGRVGALLYNYLRGSLDDPVAPPDVFKKEGAK